MNPAALPADVWQHFAAGDDRRLVDVIVEARGRWPERNVNADYIAYLYAAVGIKETV